MPACAIFFAVRHAHSPKSWPTEDWLILWPMLAHYFLCVWIAIQAPRRLADDKQSGALELLLCTPIQPREIVHGSMGILWQRFGPALAALMAVDVFLFYAYFSEHDGWRRFRDHYDFSWLAICASVVFPIQAYSLARIGLYQGLVQSSSLRATFTAILKVGLLPWLIYISFMATWETAKRHFRALPMPSNSIIVSSWAAAHLLSCAVFLAHANRQLHRNFRTLAARTESHGWIFRLRAKLKKSVSAPISGPRQRPSSLEARAPESKI